MGIEQTVANAPDLTGNETAEALRASRLFEAASNAEIASLAQSCRAETVAAGTVVLKEGDKADDVYLLLNGQLLSYSYDDCGRELPLERLWEANRSVGEQAFLSQDGARRSASVKAVTDCRVLRIPGAAFTNMLARDQALGQRLRDVGARQIRHKVNQQMALLRHLADRSEGSAGLHERSFSDGTVVFHQGEIGRELYIILSGSARVFRTEADGSIVQLSRLQPGQSFGELGLIEGKPRMATVVADGELRVLTIDQDDFHRAYHGNEQVRNHFAAVRSIYRYGAFGVTVQFTAELFDRAALGTLYQLNDGRTVIAHRIIGQDIWSVQQADAPAAAVQESYLDAAQGVERTLLIHDRVVVGAVVKGAWSAIGRLHELVLERIPLTRGEIEAFRRRGELIEAPPLAPADDVVVCQCMRVTHSRLVEAMADGCQTVQALSVATGAGTVCGGCVPRLAQLTAEALSQQVRCLEVIDRAPGVKSFRFEIPHQHQADRIRPGQHLLVEASIGGVEVRRSYTLTSPATGCGHYEITVRREPHGVMSRWLFENMTPGAEVSILPPSGTCFFDLQAPRPLVCMVGGIGVTPALSICRSAAASGAVRRIHVDYSVSSRTDIVCGDEFRRLASRHRNITVGTRVTSEHGRLGDTDVAALAAKFPEADWLVCGSKPFQVDAQRLLLERGVQPRHIHIESFNPVGGAATEAPATTAVLSPDRRRVVGYALLAAVALFVVQASLGIKWPLLDRLQASTAYSAVTGSALLLLLMLQWHLGFVRWRQRAQGAPRAYGFHIAIGPAVLGLMWLHSTHLGYALSMAVCVSFLASLATGAILAAHPRSPSWESVRRLLLGCHIVLSCAGSGFAVTHGFTALWY